MNWQKPFLMTSRADASDADLGTTGTLPGALSAIYAQGRSKVVAVPIPEYEDIVVLGAAVDAQTYKPTVALTTDDAEFTIAGSSNVDYEIVFATLANDLRPIFLALGLGQEITITSTITSDVAWVYVVAGDPVDDTAHVRIPVQLKTVGTELGSGTPTPMYTFTASCTGWYY